MKPVSCHLRPVVHLVILALFVSALPAGAIGLNRGGGGARASRQAPARANPASRPKPSYRPQSQSRQRSPSSNRSARLPQSRPQTRPSQQRPQVQRPQTRPSQQRPQVQRPQTRPDVGYRPGTRPSRPENRPSTRPSRPQTLPGRPETRPSRPGGDIGLRPSRPPQRPDRPTTLPGRPDLGNRPGGGDRPTTLPGRPGTGNRPGGGGGRPTTLPGRPGLGNRPGGGIDRPSIPDPPGRQPRPPRPDWGDRWNNNNNRFTNINNQWNSNNRTVVNNFQVNRVNQWNVVNQRWNQPGWHRQWGTPAYRTWRGSVWGYRGNRCREIWYRTGPFHYHNHFFNAHWFGSCWWHPRPVYYRHCSPWWYWRPVAWASIGFFFGQALAPAPVVYDPGTTVIYEGDTVYINGQSAGSATAYRQETIALANPPVQEIPVPAPPQVAEDASEAEIAAANDADKPQGDWLPVGVWALTQQEQGDATMFFQLSIDKEGTVAGAYKNVMTGDEQPVVGKLDFESQRVAWHIGEVTTTVYETGLSNFENDVASVFVHFGETQTQNWLLVRLPSPEMPPGTVKLPEVAAQP